MKKIKCCEYGPWLIQIHYILIHTHTLSLSPSLLNYNRSGACTVKHFTPVSVTVLQ
jgi:hypothetical protein